MEICINDAHNRHNTTRKNLIKALMLISTAKHLLCIEISFVNNIHFVIFFLNGYVLMIEVDKQLYISAIITTLTDMTWR